MKHFRITWTVDQYANTPEEAVALAILAMPVPLNEEATATTFEAIIIENGKFVEGSAVEVDAELLEDEERERFIAVLDGKEEVNEFDCMTVLEKLEHRLKQVKHLLPINLIERNDEFELDNGGLITTLNENNCTYVLRDRSDEFNTEYNKLPHGDLVEIIHILTTVLAEDTKSHEV